MWRNYLTTGVRALLKNKTYAFINIFGLAIGAAGGTFWFGFLVVFAGQMLVALVFAQLVSRWPIEGSIYQWSRRLIGNGYGWFSGWVAI